MTDNIFNYEIYPNVYEKDQIFDKKNINLQTQKNIIYPRLDIGIGEIGYGKNSGGKRIHVDNPQRLISILFYGRIHCIS